jgi:hypothetical protein
MTPPPLREPECPRLRTERPRDSTAVIALVVAIYLLPFLGGASGSIVFAREAIGPLITLVVWTTILIATIVRAHRVSWMEFLPVIGGLVVLQLLLDLHTPYLGDLVIAALHALLLVVVLVGLISRRR